MHARCTCSKMEKGILEVLLVRAERIRHTNLVGTPAYYVVTQCGNKVHKSKVSLGKDEEARWNEKFRFEFPLIDWKYLTHLKFRIMDKEFLRHGGFVGETIIYIGGMIADGIDEGILEVKPVPYNVVLEDDTYKGEIKVGLKFITNKEMPTEETASVTPVNEPRQSFCRYIINHLKSSWSRFYFYCSQLITRNKPKEN
ncbi:elicitor-responsive protein 3 isoform X2 [Manihot esculenta]|uniref:elicitor-responsive protein 3 isoform X2 n=1 Tax=Manihot esculenta TaxID=3983 RepID=UPI000B5D5D85|nr:elicitor-responsive protein 3 isoform X2 [Manihot esculenta]